MFFNLTNLLATFQIIRNEILRDLINTKKVVSFINNVLVGIEEEEGYDKIVEKIIRNQQKTTYI